MPLLAYLAVVLIVPAGVLALYSFFTSEFFSVSRTLTLESYRRFLDSPLYLELLVRSLAIGLLAATLLTLLGFAVAYAISFRLGRFGPRVLVLITATLLASYVVRIYAWKSILGTEGLLNDALLRLGVISEPLGFLLYGYFAIIVTLVYVYLPIAVLPIYAGLQDIDPRVLEASRDLGAGPVRTFWTVTVPLALPAVRIAFLFAFVLTASDYVTPGLVGGLQGQMIGATIASQFGGAGDYPLGAVLAIALLAGYGVVLTALWALMRLLGRLAPTVLRRVSSLRRPPPALGRTLRRVPWSVIVTGAVVIYLLAPLAVVVAFSFTDAELPVLPIPGLTAHWYGDVLADDTFRRVLGTSVTVAVVGVTGALLLGVPAAFAMSRRSFALRGVVTGATYAPLVLPGVVVGVALLTACTYAGIILGARTAAAAHVMLLLPYVVLVVRTRLATMNPKVEEAARDLGAGRLRTARTVVLPQIAAALLAATILATAVSLDELVVTNFAIGGDATVPVWILGQLRQGVTPAINAIAVLLLVVPLALVGLAAILLRARGNAGLLRSVRR